MSNKTLYIIRGVPGSGKSTLAHQLTKHVVETDDFMMVDGEYKYDKDKVYACHKKCFNKVLDYMAHNVSPIAVSNTFIKKKDYKPYVDLAKEFGYDVEIKVCNGDYKNIHNVPQDRVEQMKSRFQESINSLLEMNGDVGIIETIENKKQSKLNDNFKKWFGNSKVVDENGQPLVVYHGSPNTFEIFDENYFGLNNIKGFWFSNDKKVGEHYKQKSGKLYSCYIRLENPYILKTPGMSDEERLKRTHIFRSDKNPRAKLACEDLKKEGYDGILSKDDDGYIEVIAFYPNQIKSVDNNGNWSLEVDNINESKEVKFNDNFKKWFGNSKIVDESGNPMVCYHGTSQEFNEFDKSKRGIHSNGPGAGVGFWFSTSPEYFNHYKNHMEVYLSIQNPKIFKTKPYTRIELQMLWDMYNNEKDSDERYFIYKLLKGVSGREDAYDHFLWDLYSSNNQIPINQNFYGDLRDVVKLKNPEQSYENYINKLKSEGYDGIIIIGTEYDSTYTNGKNNTQIIAFEPNQIKSIKNDNRWDGSSQNIYESFEPKINDNFKKWFGNSKCVDKNGNPKVFIHRSNAKFNAFDKSKIGQRDHGWYGKGFYFGSAKQKDYKLYGKHVYKCFLRMENPFYYNEFFGSYSPNEMQMITAYDKLGILTPQESNFLQKYVDAYNHFNSNVKLKKVPQKVKDYNGKEIDSLYWVAQYNGKTTKTDPNMNPNYNTDDYAKEMFWREHYGKHFEKIRQINRECYKTRMDKMSNAIRNMGYDGIINADEYVVFEPNQIKSVKNNGNWSLETDNINEEKEIIEERLFPELSDRKYNELLWFTTPNMTANAYTKFFGKEMVADRIPAKYLVSLSSNDISLKDLVEKHRKLYDAKQVKPIANYKDFNDFITDLNKSKYLSRNDKSNIAKSGAKIIKSFGDWDLYDITTWEAAKKYGSGTTWCVTDSTSDDYFKRYTNRLPFNNYQTEEDMKKSKRSLLFLINPNTDRKMAISVLKRMDYDWYDDEIEFYNEEDEFFYTYSHSSNGSISLKDDIMKKISYCGDEWPDADVIEDYGVTEDFIMSVTQFIKDTYRMNKEEIVEDINKLRQKYKQLMNIKESANNSTNMTWEEFVEKVGRENEFDGSVVILKHNTSIVIRQSGAILVRIGKNPFKKAYSNLKTFDEIYNMLVEKGFVEEQILTETVNQHSLYHGCDLAYAVSMMIDNAMRGETIANINGKKYQGNSLTRSLKFAKDWQEERWDGHSDVLNQFWVVLELNKERLKTKYKVLPYNYWEDYFGKDYEHTIDRNGYGNQYEEFVVGRINNLRNYLDDVYLSDECLYGEYAEILAIVKRELELRGEDYSESDIEKALQTLGIHKPSPDDLNKTKIDESIKSVNREFADTKLITSPSELNQYLKTNTESRVVYDKENKWFLVGNDETSIHIHLLDDAIKDGYYQSFDCNNGEELYDNHPRNFVLFRTTSDETNEDKLYDDRYKYCYVYNDYCVFDRNLDFEETPLYKLLGEPSDFNYIGDINETKLNENYNGMPMVYTNPTYSEFHDILRRFTTVGKLSAIIDGDDIYCWDSYLKHHSTMVKYIENKLDKEISNDAIWVRFKEPNICWVSGEYFNDYTDDELEDLEIQDFEKDLEHNPVIKKYFPKGIKIKRYNNLDENYKKLSDDSGIVEVFSYNDIKGFLNRCSFGARGLLNKKDGSVYLDFVEESIHSDMVNELQSSGIDIDQDNIIRFLVYNDYMKAMDSEYAEELKFGTRGIQFLTNNDIYVLIKNYHYNEILNNLLKLDTMDDVDVITVSNWEMSENKEYEGLNRIAGFYWFDEHKFQMLKRKPVGVDNLSDDDNEFDYYHLEKLDGLIEDNKARFGIEKIGKEIVCYIEAETKSKCLRAKKAILHKYPDIVFDRFDLSWENNGFETLNEEIAFGKMVNDEMITILKNPTRNELKKNNINYARIVVDDYGNIYFGSAKRYSHAMIVGELERNNISDFEILGPGYDWGFDVFLYDQTTNTFYYRVDYITEEEEKEKLETAKDFLNTSYFNKSFGDFDVQITDREEPWEK